MDGLSVVKKEPLGNGLCLICEEPSFGNHCNCYKDGCQSCLGCKTFFRRAVLHKQNLLCKKPESCEIETSARRLCRSCRFRRCLQMGMRQDALQPQRDLIGRRKKRSLQMPIDLSQKNSDARAPIFSTSIPLETQNLLNVISQLTAVDKSIRAKKFELIQARTEARKLAEIVKKRKTLPDTLMIQFGSDISHVTQAELFALLEWSQTLPGFTHLPLNDQSALLKRFAMNHLALEYGYYTANLGLEDVWLISNGTCMPRNLNVLPEESKKLIPEDRKWRQEKLYKDMTDRCIDEIVAPLRRLQLVPEEFFTLNCGNHIHLGTGTLISDESKRTISIWRNRVISALFKFYEVNNFSNYEERFGNLVMLVGGIVSASMAMLESYQIMRLFKIVPFDQISKQLLFDVDQ